MKRKFNNITHIFLAFVLLLACTKDVNLLTEVEFQLIEQHQEEGLVNQLLETTVTVIPEAELEGYEYFFTYIITEGEGFYEDINGENLPEGEKINLNPFSADIMYRGTRAGEHRIKIIAEDLFGFKEEVELVYTLSEVPVVWTANSQVNQVLVNESALITVTLGNTTATTNTTYERLYRFSEGSGSLLSLPGNEPVLLDSYVAITPGTYQFRFGSEVLGTVIIQFNLRDSNGQELTASVTIEVVEELVDVSSIEVAPETLSLLVGATDNLTATVLPVNAANMEVNWSSNNTNIATVDTNGTVTAIAIGTATITAVSAQNAAISDQSEVTVTDGTIPVTGIEVSPSSRGIVMGSTGQLVATITPSNATNQDVIWDSDDDSIATVDANGLVTAVAVGTVTIKATSADNSLAVDTSEITVTMANIGVTGLTVAPATANLTTGATQQLTATIVPTNATNPAVDWSTDDASIATVNANGLVTGIGSGTVTITATSDDNPMVSDTSVITVLAVSNNPPTANDFAITVAGNSTNNPINVAGEISDPENDPLTVSIQAGSPLNGTASIAGTVISYTPNNGFTGNDVITYLVSDNINTPVTGTITITVSNAPNNPPTANDFTVNVVGNSTNNTIDVAGEISDPENDPLTVSLQAGSPANGTATVSGTIITYTPNNGFTGNDVISYLVSDNINIPVIATVTVVVSNVPNSPPTANDFSVNVVGNSANNTIDVAGAISDPENDPLTVTLQNGSPANGTATVAGTVITYAPNNGFTGNDVITYLVSDNINAPVAGTITVVVSSAPNDPPTANNFSVNVVENSSNNAINVATQISDPENDPLTVSIQGGSPVNGTASIAGTVISYTPNNGFTGNDVITYLVSDNINTPVAGTITVTVTAAPNDPPTANNFSVNIVGNTTNNAINLAAEISDPENDPLTISIQPGTPTNGTASIAGTLISYTPTNGYTGPDSITYLVDDGNNTPVAGVITITVTMAPNNPPTGDNFSVTTIEDENFQINIRDQGNVGDPDGDNVIVSIGDQPTKGTLQNIGMNFYNFIPNLNENGADSFTYRVDDGMLQIERTVTLNITPVNDAPIAADDNYNIPNEGSALLGVLLNDTDVDGDTMTISSFTQPTNGIVTLPTPGSLSLSYTPPNGFSGIAVFTYVVTDGILTDTGTVVINVADICNPTCGPGEYQCDCRCLPVATACQ